MRKKMKKKTLSVCGRENREKDQLHVEIDVMPQGKSDQTEF